MQQKQIVLTGPLPMSRDRVIRLVSAASAFSSHVLLEGENATINGKSMLGLLSITRSTGRAFTLITRGEDEVEAISHIAAMLTGEPDAVSPQNMKE